MTEGNLIGFTDNFADNSTDAGFQFTFFCDICREGYKTKFKESKTYKKGRLFKGIAGAISTAAQMAGKHNVGYGISSGGDAISERFNGMSPAWQKEHEMVFSEAQNEAEGHFHRCPKCTKWVCENDWNEQAGLCTVDAPRVNVEVAAARADKMVSDIRGKAATTQVFTGEIESKQTLCPACGKPAGEGKFCNNCGTSLALAVCPKCGAQNPAGTSFCGECGAKIQ
ncbi:MAG: zinc ribbon domain-containing protein [Coriobacteriia bacterium]|nr:zinc ribbon domain-containing protein [Coriobacteriia bacterium]